jgi:AAA domain
MLIEASNAEIAPVESLADGMIPRVGAGFVYGKSYWGKSLLINGELALAVANGTEFFGRKTIKGSVIVALGEGAYDATIRKQARLKREEQDRLDRAAEIGVKEGMDAARAWLESLPPYTDEKLNFWPDPFTVPVTRIGNDGEGAITSSLQRFINSAKQIKDLELVVLDSLSDFSGGLSISNDTSANRMILGLKEMVRQLNCCVICVAHPTADGKKMIGAERLFNAADFVIKIEPDENNAPDMPQSASILCQKYKYGPKFAPTGYTIEPHAWWQPEFDEDDEPTGKVTLVSSATVRQREGEQKIYNAPVDLTDDIEPYELITPPSDRPVKRSGMKRRNGQAGHRSERSEAILSLVNERPNGVTAMDVASELDIDAAQVKVYLSRAAERGEVRRTSAGVYAPVAKTSEAVA